MSMIRSSDAEKIREVFGELTQDVTLAVISSKNGGEYEQPTADLMAELGELSDRVIVEQHDLIEAAEIAASLGIDHTPAIAISSGADTGVRFYGMPAGGEFGVLVEAILDAGSERPSQLTTDTLKALEMIEKPIHMKVFFTPN